MPKYIEFIETKSDNDKRIIEVKNKRHGTLLGYIDYHTTWGKWVFTPNLKLDLVFTDECLNDISDKLFKLKNKRRWCNRRKHGKIKDRYAFYLRA